MTALGVTPTARWAFAMLDKSRGVLPFCSTRAHPPPQPMKLPSFSFRKSFVAFLGVSLSLFASGCAQPGNEGSKAIAALQARIATCTQVKVEHNAYFYPAGAKSECEIPVSLLREHGGELSALERAPWRLGKKKPATPQWLKVTLLQEGSEPMEFSIAAERLLFVDGADGETYACGLRSDKLAQAILAEISSQRGEKPL